MTSYGINYKLTIHPEEDMKVCTKLCGIPFNSCGDTYFTITNVNLMVTLEESKRFTKVGRIHPLGTMNVCTNFDGNQSTGCWVISVWTKMVDRLTDKLISSYIPNIFLTIIFLQLRFSCGVFPTNFSSFW